MDFTRKSLWRKTLGFFFGKVILDNGGFVFANFFFQLFETQFFDLFNRFIFEQKFFRGSSAQAFYIGNFGFKGASIPTIAVKSNSKTVGFVPDSLDKPKRF